MSKQANIARSDDSSRRFTRSSSTSSDTSKDTSVSSKQAATGTKSRTNIETFIATTIEQNFAEYFGKLEGRMDKLSQQMTNINALEPTVLANNTQIDTLTKSIAALTVSIKEFTTQTADVQKEVNNMQTHITTLITDQTKTNKRLSKLEERIREREIVISGIMQGNNEDLYQITLDLFSTTRSDLTVANIEDVYRLARSSTSASPSAILLRLRTRRDRDHLLACKQTNCSKLIASEINNTLGNAIVFLNINHPPELFALFKETRLWLHTIGVPNKNVWLNKRGFINYKDADNKLKHIRTTSDFQRMKETWTAPSTAPGPASPSNVTAATSSSSSLTLPSMASCTALPTLSTDQTS